MEQLLKAISKYVKVSETLRKELENRLNFETFKKREIILNESQVCTKSYFIQQGILRLYYLKDGREITEFFCAEYEWINSPKSFIKQEIDEYYIDSIEESQVWSLHLNDLMDLFIHYPEMERYARMYTSPQNSNQRLSW